MTHQCPAPGCAAEVDADQLMCPACWYCVPKPVRRAVYIAWNRGAGAGTAPHRAAIRLAVAAVRREVIPASSLKHPARGSAVGSRRRPGSSPTSAQEGTNEHPQCPTRPRPGRSSPRNPGGRARQREKVRV